MPWYPHNHDGRYVRLASQLWNTIVDRIDEVVDQSTLDTLYAPKSLEQTKQDAIPVTEGDILIGGVTDTLTAQPKADVVRSVGDAVYADKASVARRAIDAVAEGLVPGTASGSAPATNASVLNDLVTYVNANRGSDAVPHIVLPSGPIYYDTTLDWRSHVAIAGQGKERTFLYYTGSGHGMTATTATYVEQCLLQGLTLRFAGTGSGDGVNAQGWHDSVMRDVIIERFPGSGFHGVANGNWMSRFFACAFRRNGRHGIELEAENNNLGFFGCQSNMNALDGVSAEKAQGIYLPGHQSEGNGRHAFHLRGVKSFAAPGAYAEHHDLDHYAADLRPPGWTPQSPRYVVYATQASDGTRNGYVDLGGVGYLTGSDSTTGTGGTTQTDAVVKVEHTNRLALSGYLGSADLERDIQIDAATVREVVYGAIQIAGYDPAVAPEEYLKAIYAKDTGGTDAVIREPVGREDGYANLIRNGGFEAFPSATAAPAPWTAGGTVVSRETGTDGGWRLVATGNGTSTYAAVVQTLDGPEVRALAGGKGLLVFDAIVPTANVSAVTVYLRAFAGPNQTGGQLSPAPVSMVLPETDTERTFRLPFVVPAGMQSMDLRFALDNGVAATNGITLDRVAILPGWVGKPYAPRRLPDANPVAYGVLRLTPQAAPASGAVGDLYMTTAGVLMVCTAAGTPGTWAVVGAQT